MNKLTIRIKKFRDVKSPSKAYKNDAGLDFYIPNDSDIITLPPNPKSNAGVFIDSGIKIEIPNGYCGVFLNRSSIGSQGLLLGAQVVDASYRGTLFFNFNNVTDSSITLNPGQKVAQMLLLPVPELIIEEVMELSPSDRGNNCLGSSNGR